MKRKYKILIAYSESLQSRHRNKAMLVTYKTLAGPPLNVRTEGHSGPTMHVNG